MSDKKDIKKKVDDIKSRTNEKTDAQRKKEQDALKQPNINDPKDGNKHFSEL